MVFFKIYNSILFTVSLSEIFEFFVFAIFSPGSRFQLKAMKRSCQNTLFFSDVLIDLNWLQMTRMCHKVDFHKLSDNMRPKTFIYCPSVCYSNLREFYYFSYSLFIFSSFSS